MALERKSSIRKAPAADVVEALTSVEKQTATVEQEEPPQVPADRTESVPPAAPEPQRPGPGRPRGKRRMEPFSSKIEISLRDELDAYSTKYGITITDLLDEALRERLRRQ